MLYGLPMDRTGCGFYRIIWPLRMLRRELDITIVYPGDDFGLKVNVDGSGGLKSVQVPSDCTAVLLQRPTNDLQVEVIPHLKRAGVAVLVDVDDDLTCLHKSNPTSSMLKPGSGHSVQSLLSACLDADLVIASTPAILERYAPHGRGVVLRNRLRSDWRACLQAGDPDGRGAHPPATPRVSAPYLHVNAPVRDELRVGWPGALSTHGGDLDVLHRALAGLPQDPPWRFLVAGPQPNPRFSLQRSLGVPDTPDAWTGAVPFTDWLSHIASSMDIGVSPLSPGPFNEAKSWLKPLELAAAGIPAVISATSEYRHLHDTFGVHLLADDGAGTNPRQTYKSWRRQLRSLLTSPALRAELIEAGRACAEANTYAAHRDEWREALAPFTTPTV